MKLTVLGSGSSGNCYLLEHNNKVIVLDCGLPIKEITKGLNYNISNVIAVLVSHSHLDHSKSMKDFKEMGVPVFAPYCEYEQVRLLDDGVIVHSFDLPHDGTENYGFLIKWDNQKILYATDFEYCKYKFTGINHMIVECNYQEKYIETDIASFEHKVRGHASLTTCKNFVEANNSDSLRTCLAVHLGGQTCVGSEIVEELSKVARKGSQVDYARKGLTIELKETDCPF